MGPIYLRSYVLQWMTLINENTSEPTQLYWFPSASVKSWNKDHHAPDFMMGSWVSHHSSSNPYRFSIVLNISRQHSVQNLKTIVQWVKYNSLSSRFSPAIKFYWFLETLCKKKTDVEIFQKHMHDTRILIDNSLLQYY